jgi:hypothetical protein
MTKRRRVAVVMDPALGDRVAELRAAAPVWVVDSLVNRAAWGRSNLLEPNSAIFKSLDPEARADNLIAQLDDIDLHFGADSYPENPYVGIQVVGLALSEQVEAELRQRGFERFRETEDGFEADVAI